MLMSRSRSQLLLIDIQDRLAPHVAGEDTVTDNCARLAHYARQLAIPVTLTEHYPKGWAPSRPLSAQRSATRGRPKITISAWQDPVAFEWLGRGDAKEFKDLIEVIK